MLTIFIGPKNEPVTGQSLCFALAYEGFKSNKTKICYGGCGVRMLFSNVLLLIKLLCVILSTNGHKTVYITTSRSFLGFVRDFFVINLCRLFSIKVVNHLHGADFLSFRNSISRFSKILLDYTYSYINTSIVLLESMKEQYSMYPMMQVVCLSNCLVDEYTLEKKYNGTLKVIFLSNIMYSKGIVYLINAVDHLRSVGYDVHLNIAGKVLADDYMSHSEISNVFYGLIKDKKYISYHGVVSGEYKKKLLVESDFFILPSFYKMEAQPLSIIEAMSAGCVIITTDHNYLKDFICNKNGCLVAIKSHEEISDAILFFYNNHSLVQSIIDYNLCTSLEKFSRHKFNSELKNIILGDFV
ncbi:glycosyltransferase [uncultured Tolumonas sp.]|uniref:glycosyltransferase n=1 Tax=uncultured Tolumonas sp. TaxID=263765 RepID=UPI002A0A5059|nr:glycosyltransferase [uncultured Tolumonas sp.]